MHFLENKLSQIDELKCTNSFTTEGNVRASATGLNSLARSTVRANLQYWYFFFLINRIRRSGYLVTIFQHEQSCHVEKEEKCGVEYHEVSYNTIPELSLAAIVIGSEYKTYWDLEKK
jgi:hypothetical protein